MDSNIIGMFTNNETSRQLFFLIHIKLVFGLRLLIHLLYVEMFLALGGIGEREHKPFQWPLVSLVPWGTLQIRIQFIRQRFDPTLETNKEQSLFMLVVCLTWNFYMPLSNYALLDDEG